MAAQPPVAGGRGRGSGLPAAGGFHRRAAPGQRRRPRRGLRGLGLRHAAGVVARAGPGPGRCPGRGAGLVGRPARLRPVVRARRVPGDLHRDVRRGGLGPGRRGAAPAGGDRPA
ncbi:hypothetical protein [Ornithinimicrobium kibberense]|uniref:hypothetical protein n=1 Tax=Ornithinimicrobium kibberense TaxID=282060 RepID=UPI003624272C